MLTQHTERGRRIVAMLFAISFVNFFSFLAGVYFLGGDAWHGYIENGHYFARNHSAIAEVTSWQWIYSFVHWGLVIANFLAFVIAIFWLWISGDIDP